MRALIGVAAVGLFVGIVILVEWLASRKWEARWVLRRRIFQPDEPEIEDEVDEEYYE